MSIKEELIKKEIPKHIAIIMDGNGRWAKERGKIRVFGHKKGVETVRRIVEASSEIGLNFLTIYAFSTENWNRPKLEVEALMALLVRAIKNETANLMKNNVKLLAIGDHSKLPKKVYTKLEGIIKETSNNTGLTLVLALSYSSRWEIINAMKNIAKKVENKEITSEEINESTIQNHLTTANIPDPELLIRTSGEHRISNFLLWQIAYSELNFCPKYWPDYQKEDLYQAIFDFQNRERRFGKTSEQL